MTFKVMKIDESTNKVNIVEEEKWSNNKIWCTPILRVWGDKGESNKRSLRKK